MEIDPFQPFLLFLCPFPPNYFVKHKEKEARLDDAKATNVSNQSMKRKRQS